MGWQVLHTASPGPAAPLMRYSWGKPLNTGAEMGVFGVHSSVHVHVCVCARKTRCGMFMKKKLVPFFPVLQPQHHHYYQKQYQLNAKQTCLLNNWGSRARAGFRLAYRPYGPNLWQDGLSPDPPNTISIHQHLFLFHSRQQNRQKCQSNFALATPIGRNLKVHCPPPKKKVSHINMWQLAKSY